MKWFIHFVRIASRHAMEVHVRILSYRYANPVNHATEVGEGSIK